MIRYLSKPVLIGFTLLALFALLLPQNYVILAPGPTTSLLDSAVKVSNISTQSDFKGGALFSTAILATSPDQHPLGFQVLQAWADGNLVVMPRNALYGSKEKPAQSDARQHQEMVDSQGTAALAALNFISKIPMYSKPTWKAEDVKIDLKNVGGGSAGLAFALALIAKTADPNLIAGRRIAATGTIALNGKVGEIGV
jgi:Lon-like protease